MANKKVGVVRCWMRYRERERDKHAKISLQTDADIRLALTHAHHHHLIETCLLCARTSLNITCKTLRASCTFLSRTHLNIIIAVIEWTFVFFLWQLFTAFCIPLPLWTTYTYFDTHYSDLSHPIVSAFLLYYRDYEQRLNKLFCSSLKWNRNSIYEESGTRSVN